MIEVGGISAGWFIGLFLLYLLSHVLIGIKLKSIEENIKDDGARNIELEKELNNFKMLFNWWPAFYVVFTIVVLYIL